MAEFRIDDNYLQKFKTLDDAFDGLKEDLEKLPMESTVTLERTTVPWGYHEVLGYIGIIAEQRQFTLFLDDYSWDRLQPVLGRCMEGNKEQGYRIKF